MVTGSPVRPARHRDRRPPDRPRRRSPDAPSNRPVRGAGSGRPPRLDVHQPRRQRRIDAARARSTWRVPSTVRRIHPGLTPAAAPPPLGSTDVTSRSRAGQPDLEARIAAGIDRGLSRRVGGRREQREVRLPEPAEHLADDGPQLAGVAGRERARPQLGAHGVPVDAVHLRVEVRVADDFPRRVERVDRRGRLRDRRQRPRRRAARTPDGASASLHERLDGRRRLERRRADGVVLDRRQRHHLLEPHCRRLERRRLEQRPEPLVAAFDAGRGDRSHRAVASRRSSRPSARSRRRRTRTPRRRRAAPAAACSTAGRRSRSSRSSSSTRSARRRAARHRNRRRSASVRARPPGPAPARSSARATSRSFHRSPSSIVADAADRDPLQPLVRLGCEKLDRSGHALRGDRDRPGRRASNCGPESPDVRRPSAMWRSMIVRAVGRAASAFARRRRGCRTRLRRGLRSLRQQAGTVIVSTKRAATGRARPGRQRCPRGISAMREQLLSGVGSVDQCEAKQT